MWRENITFVRSTWKVPHFFQGFLLFFVILDTSFGGFDLYLRWCGALGAGGALYHPGLRAPRLSQLLPLWLSHVPGHLLNFCKVVLGFDFHEGVLVTSLLSHPRLLLSEESRHSWVWDLFLIFLLSGHSEDHIFLYASFALRDFYESISLCGLLLCRNWDMVSILLAESGINFCLVQVPNHLF